MSDAVAMRQLVRASAKRKAIEDLDMRPSKVIIHALMEVDTSPEELLMEYDLSLVSASILFFVYVRYYTIVRTQTIKIRRYCAHEGLN